jgi:hypothetical protein
LLSSLTSIVAFILASPTQASVDTLFIREAGSAPALDGRPAEHEYGSADIALQGNDGEARIWLRRYGNSVFVAAVLPDTSFYWGDDFVFVIDVDGSGGERPGIGDRAWYIRRMTDSSIMLRATGDGRWEPPEGARPIGAARAGSDWELATTTSPGAWIVELRLDASLFAGAGGRAARVAIRTFNDKPAPTWVTWPTPPNEVPPQRLERLPRAWIPVGSPSTR